MSRSPAPRPSKTPQPRTRRGFRLPHRPRLGASALLVVLVWVGLALLTPVTGSTRVVLAFDAGAVLFLCLTFEMLMNADPAQIHRDAHLFDAGAYVILVLTVGAAIYAMVAVTVELHVSKSLPPPLQALHIGLGVASALLCWLLTHSMFTLHYGHLYYGDGGAGKPRGGLDFPGGHAPDYWDFAYFSFVIGMTCQTSDVGISRQPMRRMALAHGMLSFLFNTVILALTINVLAGLL